MAITRAPLLHGPISIELANTVWADADGIHDELETTAGAVGWLRATAEVTGWPGHRVTDDVAERLRTLRDAVRRLAAAATNDDRVTARSATRSVRSAVATVNAATASVPTWPVLRWGAAPSVVERSAGSAPDVALATLARDLVDLLGGPMRAELRACGAPGCVLYFVRDHPRREWCSSACGNRARVARHYARHRPAR